MQNPYECVHFFGEEDRGPCNTSVIQMQQVQTRQGHVVLVSLCQDQYGNVQGHNMSALVSETLGKWFYSRVLSKCKRSIFSNPIGWNVIHSCKRLLYELNESILQEQEINNHFNKLSISLILCFNKHYFVIQMGDHPIYVINYSKQNKKVISSSYLGSSRNYCVRITKGKLKRNDAIFCCTQKFFSDASYAQFLKGYSKNVNRKGVVQKQIEEVARRNKEAICSTVVGIIKR